LSDSVYLSVETASKMPDFVRESSLHCTYKDQHCANTFADVFADSVAWMNGRPSVVCERERRPF
jgi:hypothetical protein